MTQVASSAKTSPIRHTKSLAPARRQSAGTSPPSPFGQPGHEVGDPGAAVDALPATQQVHLLGKTLGIVAARRKTEASPIFIAFSCKIDDA
jgi:hypothetical protein